MHICVLFFNIGGYHVARLEAARQVFDARRWTLSAIQVAATTTEHPWGNISLDDYVHTLKPQHSGDDFRLGDTELLTRLLDTLNPDVVAIPGWGFDFARAALNWARKRKRVAILMSESKEDDSPRVWWKEIAKRHLWVRHFSAAIVGGTRHVNYLQRLGMSDDRIFRGYDTVDNGYFVDQVDQLRSADRSPLVVEHVGGQKYFLAANRFIRRKNLDTLIHAFHQFAENHETADQWSLVLLGDGPDLPYLKQLTERLDVGSRVLFPGFMSYEDICRWYASAEVFVHPAKSEQWGLVVNEAMAAGLPVLLSNACGCFPDLMVEEQTGFSFSPDNTDELASRMTRLAGDPELRTKMGHAAREHIQQHFEPAEFGRGLAAAIDAAT